MKTARLWIVTAALALMTALACYSQATANKKAYTFHGKVQAVDKKAKSLTVDGEAVEGWMGAMTMDYKVDDPSILDKVKAGDRITATVYDGDEVLHKVQIAGKNAGSSKSKQ